MTHRNHTSDLPPSSGDAPEGESAVENGAPLAPGEDVFVGELEAGPILAEFLAGAASAENAAAGLPADAPGDDIHAALAGLGDDAIDQLDPAAQLLIDSVDLFDVPADGTDDAA